MPVARYLVEHTERTRRSHQPGPLWLMIAATVLAMNAGFIDMVCLHSSFTTPTSHMTGTTTQISNAILTGDGGRVWTMGGIILSFLAGSVLCGVLIGGVRLMPGRRYGVGLGAEAALLGVASAMLVEGWAGGLYFAAAACGLQNALATSHCGMTLRTTHMTGILTDLGILIGHWLRDRRREGRKLVLLSLLFTGFVVGGALGGLAAAIWDVRALWVASGVSAAAAIVYGIWHARWRGAAVVPPVAGS